MANFSDRMGITKAPKQLLINDISKEVRVSFWNLLHSIFENPNSELWITLLKALYFEFFKISITKVPYRNWDARNDLEERFNLLEWYEVFNLMELILKLPLTASMIHQNKVYDKINAILTEEYSGYRLVNGEFLENTNETEIDSIKLALSSSQQIGLNSVSTHIAKSISLLSKKPNPDYLNSIKESISAVESACKLLSKESSGGLLKPLNILAEKIQLHPQLKQAFINLYNYTSDEGGIRHPILDKTNSSFDEAKFMLVTCSAFVNYIISKTHKK